MDSKLPPLPHPLTTSEFWDAGIEWSIASERTVRKERERQLEDALTRLEKAEELLWRKQEFPASIGKEDALWNETKAFLEAER